MKDKLRELAVKIIHDGESLPMLEISKGIYRLQKFNDGKWTSLDDDELLEILDTEGDGVAVAWVADLAPGVERPKEYMGIFTPYKDYADHLAKRPEYVVTPLYPHPARSGVVSDASQPTKLEDVVREVVANMQLKLERDRFAGKASITEWSYKLTAALQENAS